MGRPTILPTFGSTTRWPSPSGATSPNGSVRVHLVSREAAILLPPTIVGLLGDAELPADVRHREAAREAALRLPELVDDVLCGVALPGHPCPLSVVHYLQTQILEVDSF
jgi:hypothetical protein